MTIRHHPQPDHLMSYAAGTMSEAGSVLIASHLTLCPHCRAETRCMEEVGGALLETLPGSSMDSGLTQMLKSLDGASGKTPPTPAAMPAMRGGDVLLPRPLHNLVAVDERGRLPWRHFLGMDYISIKTNGRARARLLRIPSGGGLPYHAHIGDELVLVLSGGFRDQTGIYHRGDVATADASLTHTPTVVPGEACICMTVNAGPILPGRFLALFARFFRGDH